MSRKRLARISFACVALALGAMSSCAALTSFDCLSEPCTQPADAGTDVGAKEAGCALKKPPPPPDQALLESEPTNYVMLLTEPSLALPDKVAEAGDAGANDASASAEAAAASSPPTAGIDLDNACTCQGGSPPGPSSCVNPRATESLCDEPGGVDRQFRKLLRGFVNQQVLGDAALRGYLRAGRLGILVQLSGYNGELNDGLVRVDILNAFLRPIPVDAGNPAEAIPKLDETDPWVLDNDTASILDPATKRAGSTYTTTGYVSNGVLVANKFLNSVKMAVRFEANNTLLSESIDLEGPTLVATLRKTGSDFTIADGYIAGKWAISDALRLFQSAGGCGRDVLYETARANFCSAADIAKREGPPTAECDAISVVLGFTSTKANYVGVGKTAPRACPGVVADDCARPKP